MYVYKYFFVKPSSTYPVEKIEDYFIKRCNFYQANEAVDDFIIGSLFNAREMQQVMFFSDATRDAHSMADNVIYITSGQEPIIKPITPLIPMEILNILVVGTPIIPTVVTTTKSITGITLND
jgi:hypothetical protein